MDEKQQILFEIMEEKQLDLEKQQLNMQKREQEVEKELTALSHTYQYENHKMNKAPEIENYKRDQEKIKEEQEEIEQKIADLKHEKSLTRISVQSIKKWEERNEIKQKDLETLLKERQQIQEALESVKGSFIRNEEGKLTKTKEQLEYENNLEKIDKEIFEKKSSIERIQRIIDENKEYLQKKMDKYGVKERIQKKEAEEKRRQEEEQAKPKEQPRQEEQAKPKEQPRQEEQAKPKEQPRQGEAKPNERFQIEDKQEKILQIEDKANRKNKVYFDVRTGKYQLEYIVGSEVIIEEVEVDKNLLSKKGKKQLSDEIISKYPEIEWKIRDVDLNLFNILSKYDNYFNLNKANEYLKAVLEENKELMPAEVIYDIRAKDSNGEKQEGNLSFLQKMKMKKIANRQAEMNIATVRKDRSLWKKIALGLGLGALGIGGLLKAGDQPVRTDYAKVNDKLDQDNNLKKEVLDKVKEAVNEMQQETDFVSVKEGTVYTNALDEQRANGSFKEDMDCQISNRAILERMEDGTERIVATSKGKTWQEAKIDISQYQDDKYVEKYALEAIEGQTDSRGYRVFGWVNADECTKLYEQEKEINGQIYKTYESKQASNKGLDHLKVHVEGLSQEEINNAMSMSKADKQEREM